jgi:hypothetical protein
MIELKGATLLNQALGYMVMRPKVEFLVHSIQPNRTRASIVFSGIGVSVSYRSTAPPRTGLRAGSLVQAFAFRFAFPFPAVSTVSVVGSTSAALTRRVTSNAAGFEPI